MVLIKSIKSNLSKLFILLYVEAVKYTLKLTVFRNFLGV